MKRHEEQSDYSKVNKQGCEMALEGLRKTGFNSDVGKQKGQIVQSAAQNADESRRLTKK